MSLLNYINNEAWNILKLSLDHKICENLNETDREGNNALHLTCEKGQSTIVKQLLDHGLNVNEVNRLGRSALHLAAANNHFECVELLIEHGANVNHLDKNGWSPIFDATNAGNARIVQYLHNKNANIHQSSKHIGNVLHIAAERNHKGLIVYFITQQININCRNGIGQTPLAIAITNGNSEIAIVLIGYNAEIISHQAQKSLLHIAIEHGDERVTRLLVKSHDVNILDGEKRTPLLVAAEVGHEGIVRYLLKKGGNPNMQDTDGYTPLHAAIQNGHLDVIKTIVFYDYSKSLHKVDIELTTKHGDNLLHLLAMSSRLRTELKMEMLYTLLNLNLLPLVVRTNCDFRTPLHYANEHFCKPLIIAFINMNADVDEIDRFGRKPKDYCEHPEGHGSKVVKKESFKLSNIFGYY